MSGEGLFLFEGHGTPGFPSPPRKQAIFNDLAENPFVLSAGDIDGDSDLDLWMGQYKVPYQGGQMPTPFDDANDGYPAFLMINDGRGVFSPIKPAPLVCRPKHSGEPIVDPGGSRQGQGS